jgi:hypothetical protein
MYQNLSGRVSTEGEEGLNYYRILRFYEVLICFVPTKENIIYIYGAERVVYQVFSLLE